MTTEQQTQIDLYDIDFQEKIGQGNAPVFKAVMGGRAIAVKKMDCDPDEIPREVEVHSILPSHPNVLPLLGYVHSEDGFTIYICTELADKSLYHHIHKEKKKPSLQQSTKWAMQIARGMQHIHQHGLAHRDLKSANVLLFEDKDATKLCDFGSARPLERTATMTGPTGTVRWMAPEFNDKADTKVNQRCDVFSYGMVLYEIFAHELPFLEIEEEVDVLSSVQEGKRPPIPPDLPVYIKVLMLSCWEHKPHDRPTFDAILQVLATPPNTEKVGRTPLQKAAQSGDTDAVQQLMKDGVNVNAQSMDGKTALHLASEQGHVSVVHMLIKYRVDINLQDKEGNTAVHLAASQGHLEVVQLLLEKEADVGICDKDGASILYVASQGGHTDVVDTLLKSGVNPNLAITVSPYSAPLGISAQKGHIQTVERLLEGGARINLQDEFGCSALYVASQEGLTDVVDKLLKNEADPNLATTEHSLPLLVAAEKGFTETVKRLLEGGANLNDQDKFGNTALFWASGKGHVAVVQLLLQNHADVGICNENGLSPLYTASAEGYTEIVDILLKNGGDPNVASTTPARSVPLGVAAQEGNTETVKRLLEGGANTNHQDAFGHTALYFASRKGHLETVRALLQQHADISICGVDGLTAVETARGEGHIDIVHLLQQYKHSHTH